MHLLFVCTGNICRSPSAERLAAAYAAEAGLADFTASSAGTRAVIGHPVHSEAARVLETLGGDSAGFAARQLTARIAGDADLVVAMTRAHRDAVLELAPRQLRRAFTLTEVAALCELGAQAVPELAALRPQLRANDVADIPDPIGQDPDVFDAVGAQIAELLGPVVRLCAGDQEKGEIHGSR